MTDTFAQPFTGATVTVGDGPLDLIGTHEVKERHGLTKQQIGILLDAGDFPQPVATLKVGRVWNGGEVAEKVDALKKAGRINKLGNIVPWRYAAG